MRLAEVENQNVANKLFDMGVNMGVHQAAVYAQRAVNSQGQQLAEDGKIGSKTLAATNAIDPQTFYGLLCQFSEWHYRHIAANSPAQAVNLAGWMKRASA
jgi:lysozyme family protein